ncbi:Glycosyl hydrolases family 32 superfamily [Apiospora arundinis]
MAFVNDGMECPEGTESIPRLYPLTPKSLSPPLRPRASSSLEQGDQQATFKRWRPSFHLQPAEGWMNDPCAPGYDPATGLYHVSFQWNPQDNEWGDIAWGHATSPDLVLWNIDQQPSLLPDKPYDHLGVFTGCLHTTKDASPLTYFYTSVNSLPIHHTLPYQHGCESLSIATSSDKGHTWVKHPSNPIIPGAPSDVKVTGWRDPFVSRWPSLSRVLDKNIDNLYGIISGGIVDKTPTTFIYSICPSDLTKWEYLGPLVDVGLNMRPSRWSGDLGRNWEVTNFLTLHDSLDASMTRDFLIMGTEGCIEKEEVDEVSYGAPKRPARCQLWMAGSLKAVEGTGSVGKRPIMEYSFGGHLDHGCYYAANSFFDPVTQSHIIWGWITEDDLGDTLRRQQGWSGMLSLPRRIQLTTIPRVTRAWNRDITLITSVEATPDGLGTYTLRTLTSVPDPRVVDSLRSQPGVKVLHVPRGPLFPKAIDIASCHMKSKTWELSCRIKVAKNCRKTGLRIGHNDDFSKETVLYFEPMKETFTIERPSFGHSLSDDSNTWQQQINSALETAAHTLFTTLDHATGDAETEPLEIRIWRDNSVLEVFVNGRTAITTRIYAGDDTFGVRLFAEDEDIADTVSSEEDCTRLEHAIIWDGIGLR